VLREKREGGEKKEPIKKSSVELALQVGFPDVQEARGRDAHVPEPRTSEKRSEEEKGTSLLKKEVEEREKAGRVRERERPYASGKKPTTGYKKPRQAQKGFLGGKKGQEESGPLLRRRYSE